MNKSEKISLGTKEIAKRVRKQLKNEFKDCKFSVRIEYFSMGSSITVSLMKADRKIKLDFNHISEMAIYRQTTHHHYTLENLKKLQNADYHQLSNSPFYHYQKYDVDYWNNGVFLTYQGYTLLKRVCQIVEEYHYVDSDIQTDYYSTNFYFHLQLGKWDRPFIDGLGFKLDETLEERVKARDAVIKTNFLKAEEEERKRQDEAHQYKKLIKPDIPTGATHVIDGSGFRELTDEERRTGRLEKGSEKR